MRLWQFRGKVFGTQLALFPRKLFEVSLRGQRILSASTVDGKQDIQNFKAETSFWKVSKQEVHKLRWACWWWWKWLCWWGHCSGGQSSSMQVTQGFKYELLFERGPMVAFLQYVYTSATCWDQCTMGLSIAMRIFKLQKVKAQMQNASLIETLWISFGQPKDSGENISVKIVVLLGERHDRGD